ncbi:hypothetical protein J2X72_004292 [Phyllobacterium sp. 1468]|nr:hypothetical protein [Phyllobacterium sp. 1468]
MAKQDPVAVDRPTQKWRRGQATAQGVMKKGPTIPKDGGAR